MNKVFIAILFFSGSLHTRAQTNTPIQYIELYKDIAISEMKRMGVPAAITLAQGILESESGNSMLVKKSNNHFGIKCKSSWTGGGVTHDDDAIGECFRKYETAEESYRDHSNFLRANSRYNALFNLDITDYEGWARGLKKAGYATNPRYPEILIRNIEQYNLQRYTLAGMADVPKYDASKYEDDKDTASIANTNTIGTIAVEDVVDEANTILDAPDKKIYINGSKCVFVKKGTSLLVVATKNDVNLNKILEYNELAEDGILGRDQYIYLQKKSKTGDRQYYIVQNGESLYDVAQKNGIQLGYLLSYNNLTDGDKVEEGTKLLLKPVIIKERTREIVQTKRLHTTAPKENLYSIAKKYGITVEQLKEWNNLAANELKIGQVLIVAQ